MADIDRLIEAQINATTSQTKAINRLGNSLESLVSKVGEVASGFKKLQESITAGTADLKDGANKVVEYYASTTKSWSEMATNIAEIQQGLGSSKRSSSNVTTPHGQLIDLTTPTGIKAWHYGTKLPSYMDDWSLLIGPESRDDTRKLGDHFRFNGYFAFLNIPKNSSGKPKANPTTLAGGQQVAARELSDFFFIFETQNLTRKHVLEFVGLIHGDISDGLHIPTTLVQKTLDLNSTGNNGNDALIAESMQQYRIRSDMIMHILREVYDPTALASLDAHKDLFTWTRECDGTEFYDGITCLWLILEAIEPKTVIDVTELEKTLQESKLLGPPNNGDVRAYFSLMKRTRDELIKRHGPERFSEQRYLQALFRELLTIEQPVFKQYIQSKYTAWTENLTNFDLNKSMTGIDNVYSSLLTAGDWDVEPVEDPKVIALSTELQKVKSQLKKTKKVAAAHKDSSSSNGGSKDSGGDEWRKVRKGDRIICPHGDHKGEPYFWCKDHCNGNGMYMPSNSEKGEPAAHDHAQWQARKDRFNKKHEENKKKRKGDDSSTSSVKLKVDRGSSRKSKKQKQVQLLVTQGGMDHGAAVELVGDLSDCSSDEESKA